MNRFRTGRAAPPWVGGQTGPMTVDVEALMATRDRDQVKYVSPLNARHEHECVPPAAPACAEAVVEAERVAEATGRAVTDAKPESLQRQGTALAVPQTAEHPGVSTPEEVASLLAEHPALRAAMEALEKRGDPILISVDAEPPAKRRRPKAKRPKRKSRPIANRVNLCPAAPRKQSRPKTQAEVDLSHHQRHCTICHHPEREAIEEAFLQWCNVRLLAAEFHISAGDTAIYRHARALKLFKQRSLTLRSSLEFVIEQSERIMPTAEGLVKAIRAYTRINDQGEWIDTPTTHIVQVVAMPPSGDRNLASSHSAQSAVRIAQNDPEERRAGIALNVRKRSGDIIESAAPQPLLPDTAPRVESDVTN
jgi:hypothetical protein